MGKRYQINEYDQGILMLKPCSHFWTDINLNIFRKEIVNCCKRYQQNEVKISDFEKYGTDFWTKRPEVYEDKKVFLEGKFPKGCKSCALQHPNSLYNTWNWWKDKPQDFFVDLLDRDETYKIEIALSTTCNMTCLYCGPKVSSSWADVLGKPVVQIDDEWKKAALESLFKYIQEKMTKNTKRVVYTFLGGETFLDLSFWEILDRIADIHDNEIEINFISNLNVKPKLIQRLVNLANAKPNIKWRISPSIEDLGERAEAVREGLDFKLFESNYDWILSEPAIDKIAVLPTMNLLTIHKHTEFLKWVLSKNIKIRGAKNLHKTWTVSLNRVTEPDWLDPAIMPKSSRLEIDRAISFIKNESKRFGDTKNITDMYLGNLRDLRNVIGSKRTPKMIEILKWKLDKNTKLFKRDYYKIFPELKDIVDENK
tara:strand:+ start:56171 stop:57445 length:1275 start_codon:yes stop_codon:yes gene_type:complete